MASIDQILKAHRSRLAASGTAVSRQAVSRQAVLGTVVELLGSGYRRPGARILIFDDGRHVGAISGGCLEKDVARNAQAWIADGPQTVLFDTRSNRFEPLGKYGTGCEGVVHLLLEPTPPPSGLDPLEALAELRGFGADEAARDGVLVTSYAASAPDAALGCVAIVERDQVRWAEGFPQHLRSAVHEAARGALTDQRTCGLRVPDQPSDQPSGQQAEWRFLIEYVRPPIELVVVGTGPDAEALVRVAAPLGWRVRVVGTDPTKLDARRFDGADTVCLPSASHAGEVDLTPHSYVVQMTHHFEQDARMLPHWLDSPAPYVGLLGPKSRTGRLMTQLFEDGALPDTEQLDSNWLDKLATPVGLDLGGEDPYEVAVSIVSEIVARKNGRRGGALSERQGSIHEPHAVESKLVESKLVEEEM
jgi:xanthine/CO dehydrogenase XdhC/CoxF family maturation factor